MDSLRRLLPAALAAGLLFAPSAEAAPDCTKEFVAGAWTSASSWAPNGVPAATDVVCIPAGRTATFASGGASVKGLAGAGGLTISGGTLSVTGDASIQTLAIASGTLGGTGTIDVTGTLTWSGGTMSDAGTTRIAAGATLVSEGTSTVFLASGRRIENAGTVDLRSDRTISGSGTLGVLHNTGTVMGTGTTTISAAVENDGELRADSGVIRLTGGDGPGGIRRGLRRRGRVRLADV